MIERRETASGATRYDVRLRGPDGKERSRTFRTKQEAKAYETAEIARRNRGDWIDPRDAARSFAEIASEWFDSNPSKRESSRARDEITLRCHLLPRFGSMPIGRIRTVDVQSWVNEASRERAPRTVRRDYGVLRAVLRYAEATESLGRSPCRGVNLPKVEKLDRPIINADDLQRLVDELGRHGLMALLGAVLGLRWGEVAGLRARRIDFDDATISIVEQVVRDARGASMLGAPKSDAGVRTLAVPHALLTLLGDHLAEQNPEGIDPQAFIFPDTSGGHLAYNAWRRRVWDPAAHRAGLGKVDTTAGGARYTGVTFHDLRRANATALIGAGVDVKTAQHRLGHSDVRLTLDVYAQAVDAADRSAAERIGLHFLGIDDDGNT
ncbi:MAG TPA: site-specific integrase [Acidimicrobiales bacterium]|nr:site-specific integrase [Acidimicrobiales bacterium]